MALRKFVLIDYIDYRYCFYSVVQNGFFCRQGGHVAPINVKFGTGERTRGPLPVSNFTFMGAEMSEYSPLNCQNFEFWQ